MLGHGKGKWSTPQIDARIIALKADGVFFSTICDILWTEFRVQLTKAMVLRRARTLNIAPNDRVPHADAADPPTAAWRGPGSDAEFASVWLAGVPSREMAAKWAVNLDRIHRRRRELNLPPRPGGPQRPDAVPRASAPPKPRVIPSPTRHLIPSQSPGGRHGSAFMFRGLVNPPPKDAKPTWRPGQCHWPLTCDEPAQGNYCARHRVLARAA